MIYAELATLWLTAGFTAAGAGVLVALSFLEWPHPVDDDLGRYL